MLIAFFRSIFEVHGFEGSNSDYLRYHQRDVQSVCQVLEALGLVTSHEPSPLGWRPTRRFWKVIHRAHCRPDLEPSRKDLRQLNAMLSGVPGRGHCVSFALEALRLIRSDDDLDDPDGVHENWTVKQTSKGWADQQSG